VRDVGLPSTYSLDVKRIDSEEKLNECVKELASSKMIAFDTETTSKDPLRAQIVGISFAVREGEGYYIPLGHKENTRSCPSQK
jgi:DNA polymerase-1